MTVAYSLPDCYPCTPGHLLPCGRALCSDLSVEIKPAFRCLYEGKEGCLVASFFIPPFPPSVFCLLFQHVDLYRSVDSTLFNVQWKS